MNNGIREIIIKYALIFFDIFIGVLSVMICYNFTQNKPLDTSIYNYIVVFMISLSIYLLFVLYKIFGLLCIFIRFVSLQQQLEYELKKASNQTKNINLYRNDNNKK